MKKNITLLSTLFATPIISGVGVIAVSCAKHNDEPETTEDINLVGTNNIEMFSTANNYLGKLNFELNNTLGDKTLTCEISSQSGKISVSIDGDILVDGKNVQVYLSPTHIEDLSIGDKTVFSLTFKINDKGETVLDKTINSLSIEYAKVVKVPTSSLDIDSEGNLFGLTDSWEEHTSCNTLVIPHNVYTIQPNAFKNMPDNIKSLVFEQADYHEVYLRENAFNNCKGLTYIKFLPNIAYVDHAALWDCSNVLNLDLSEWPTEATANPFDDANGFSGWSNRGRVIYNDTNYPAIKYDLYYMLNGAGLPKTWINVELTETEDETFRYLVNNDDGEKIITGLTLSSSSITDIVIPSDVTIIAPNAFKNRTWGGTLAGSIACAASSKLRRIGAHAFESNREGNVVADFSNSIAQRLIVDACAFKEATAIGTVSFNTSDNTSINLGASCFVDNTTLKAVAGHIDRVCPKTFYNTRSLQTVALDRARWIGQEAFRMSVELDDISLKSAIYIAKSAFEGCKSLKSVSSVGSLVYVDDFAFAGASIASIEIPGTIEYIGNGVFKGCKNIEKFVVAENPYYVSNTKGTALYSKTGGETKLIVATNAVLQDLVETTLDMEITSIKPYAFYGLTTNQTTLDFTKFRHIKKLGEYSFAGLKSSSSGFSIKFPFTINSIDNFVFIDSDIVDINLTEMSLVKLGESLFENCKKLVEITIPSIESLSFIPKQSFCKSGVKTLTISKNILEIQERAFSMCDSLIYIDVSDFEAVPNWTGEQAFDKYVVQGKNLTIKINNKQLQDNWWALFSKLGVKIASSFPGEIVWEYLE